MLYGLRLVLYLVGAGSLGFILSAMLEAFGCRGLFGCYRRSPALSAIAPLDTAARGACFFTVAAWRRVGLGSSIGCVRQHCHASRPLR